VPNGKPGDHPVTDIVAWDIPRFDQELDDLIREFEATRPAWEMDEWGDPMWDMPPLVDLIHAADSDPEAREKLRAELTRLCEEFKAQG
jgi:hypothetical protein